MYSFAIPHFLVVSLFSRCYVWVSLGGFLQRGILYTCTVFYGATFSPSSPSSRVRDSMSRFVSSSWFGHLLESGFFLLQFSGIDFMYSADGSSLSVVSILRAPGAFFRPMCAMASSISSLAMSPKNSQICGPSMICSMSIHWSLRYPRSILRIPRPSFSRRPFVMWPGVPILFVSGSVVYLPKWIVFAVVNILLVVSFWFGCKLAALFHLVLWGSITSYRVVTRSHFRYQRFPSYIIRRWLSWIIITYENVSKSLFCELRVVCVTVGLVIKISRIVLRKSRCLGNNARE